MGEAVKIQGAKDLYAVVLGKYQNFDPGFWNLKNKITHPRQPTRKSSW